MAVTKNKINHARLCMMGGCRNKNCALYSKRTDVFNKGLYLCPDCAKEIGLLSGLVVPAPEEETETDTQAVDVQSADKAVAKKARSKA